MINKLDPYIKIAYIHHLINSIDDDIILNVTDCYGPSPTNFIKELHSIDFDNKCVYLHVYDKDGNSCVNSTNDDWLLKQYYFEHITVKREGEVILKW